MKTLLRIMILGSCLLAIDLSTNGALDLGKPFTSEAEARVGRPLTPVSVAGVARRTSRRQIHRTSVYVATLPMSCTTVIMEGATLHQCGSTYYQPYNNQYVVVNVD